MTDHNQTLMVEVFQAFADCGAVVSHVYCTSDGWSMDLTTAHGTRVCIGDTMIEMFDSALFWLRSDQELSLYGAP
jgi:hypothetical protein